MSMAHTITLSDKVFDRLERLSLERQLPYEAVLEQLLEVAEGAGNGDDANWLHEKLAQIEPGNADLEPEEIAALERVLKRRKRQQASGKAERLYTVEEAKALIAKDRASQARGKVRP